MNNIKEVVVVEGYHDLSKLKSIFPEVDVIITNGSEISEETLNELKILNKTRGLILFLDPDYQGERIRRIINDHVGVTKHAFLRKRDCINKNKTKVGIEHANNDIIKHALSKTYTNTNITHKISYQDMADLGLVGKKDSRQLREKLTNELGIGLCNGKTLIKKLNMFSITLNQIRKIIRGD